MWSSMETPDRRQYPHDTPTRHTEVVSGSSLTNHLLVLLRIIGVLNTAKGH
jgi:hypothetical protein